LYPEEDDDLIAFFDGIIPRLRAAMVKQALRSGDGLASNQAEADDETLDALELLIS
jgi:hypothetical protein